MNLNNEYENKDYFELPDGEVYFWIEQNSSIQLKAISEFNDPVDLSGDQALMIANALNYFAGKIDNPEFKFEVQLLKNVG